MHSIPRDDKSYNWKRYNLKGNNKNKNKNERARALFRSTLDCTVTIGLYPPRIGIVCKSIGKLFCFGR